MVETGMRTGELRSAHAGAADWRQAAQACVAGLGGAGTGANLGFLYASDAYAEHLPAIADYLGTHLGVAHWVGTVGVGICSTGIEYFDTPAMAVLVGRFPEDAYRVFPTIDDDLAEFDTRLGDWCERARPYFAVVHGDPGNGQIASLVSGLAGRLDGGFLVGGLASSRGPHPQLAHGLTAGGLSGVLFSPQVTVATRHTQGCVPLGPRHEVTRCRGNVLEELDGRAALDVFMEDMGEMLARDPARLGATVYAGLPVRGSDTGDYLVRNLAGIDEERRLVAVAELLEAGDALMFCRRDPEAAREDMKRMLAELKRSLDGPPRGGVYHTCLARGPNLFGADSQELKIIEEELGSFPLVGFFGNGEISHDRLYAYTGVLTLFV
jgi:small ligand-binding sensory domain FIST